MGQAGTKRSASPLMQYRSPVGFGPSAVHGGANRAEAAVYRRADSVLERPPKAGPARAAVELHHRSKQRQIAARAIENTRSVLAVERARERPFRRLLAQHRELIRSQEPPPLLLGMRHFERFVGAHRDTQGTEYHHGSHRPHETATRRIHLEISRRVF
jgi:hypothetical protein